MGKYDSIGGEAHEGDMERAQLALQRQQLNLRAQAQQFDQQRAMALDADRRKQQAFANKQSEDQTAYARERDAIGDARYEQQQARQDDATAYARERDAVGDARYERQQSRLDDQTAYARERDAIGDARYEQQQARQQQAMDFDQFLQSEANKRAQAKFDEEMAEFARIKAERDEAQRMNEASFAALVETTFRNGEDDGHGNILLPKQDVDAWNKMSGANIAGISATYGVDTNGDGRVDQLDIPQITMYTLDEKTNTLIPEVMSSQQMQRMMMAYPTVPTEMGNRFGNLRQIESFLGGGKQQQTERVSPVAKFRLEQANKQLDLANKRYNALVGAPNYDDTEAWAQQVQDARNDVIKWSNYINEATGIAFPEDSTETEGDEQKKPRFTDTY